MMLRSLTKRKGALILGALPSAGISSGAAYQQNTEAVKLRGTYL